MKLIYSDRARRELVLIYYFLVRQGAERSVALAFVAQLRLQCHKLSQLPGTLGRARNELEPGIRSFAHRSYVIFFRYRSDRFEIVDILEGHRDIDTYFQN